MDSATLVKVGLGLSLGLTIFSLALRAGAAGTRLAFGSAGLMIRSLVAMYVVMPAVAVLIAVAFKLSHALEVALVLLALSPVPPVLPGKQMKAGGGAEFVLGLLVVSAVAAIVVVPAGLAVIGRLVGRDLSIPFGVTTSVVATSVLLPVAAGLVVGRFMPGFADKAARPLAVIGTVLLVMTFLPLLYAARHVLAAQLGHYTVLAIVLFILTGLAVGHFLGGPNAADRGALALATATRHPGVAIAVQQVVAPDEKGPAVVMVLYLLVGMLISAPYVARRKRPPPAAGAA